VKLLVQRLPVSGMQQHADNQRSSIAHDVSQSITWNIPQLLQLCPDPTRPLIPRANMTCARRLESKQCRVVLGPVI